MLGDALWALMAAMLVSLVKPDASRGRRCAAALAISFAVEFSQLIHGPRLDALRHTTLGRLALGSGFEGRDLGSYVLGVLAFWLLDRALGKMRS